MNDRHCLAVSTMKSRSSGWSSRLRMRSGDAPDRWETQPPSLRFRVKCYICST
jgi:hypothetical protein